MRILPMPKALGFLKKIQKTVKKRGKGHKKLIQKKIKKTSGGKSREQKIQTSVPRKKV